MSDKITACVVKFETSLAEEEKQLLIEAIQRFSGIEGISLQYDLLPPMEPDSAPVISLPQKTNPVPEPLPPEEHRRVPQPGPPTPDRVDPAQQRSGDIQTESSYMQQRYLIDFAIKWGIKSKIVNWDNIQGLSAEEIVSTAFDLIKKMPEEEIKKIENYIGEFKPV